jgi:hypothetical protein
MTDFFFQFYSLIFNLLELDFIIFFKLDALGLMTSVNNLKSEHNFFFKSLIILFIFYRIISVT